ncbi:hypothetical protein JX265_013402 [Neoarthrinium moseri]|uniref:AMP-dependent synthetase/ligase domain-containing protein n=1 Tax=Neoarthrinium moseri TaxID=1658444 RepID=A0A9Q0AHS8_9PEZI|nr:hypothetical protein JX265_013402 [Neoarthrinium moseri]
MPAPELNYFTCTLGEAALWKRRQGHQEQQAYKDVIELVDLQAQELPDSAAIGFANFVDADTQAETLHQPSLLSFRELSEFSVKAAAILEQAAPPSSSETIGLLCSSSLDFLLTWLGLMRLGHTVFLLAPQLSALAIEHLCHSATVKSIFAGRSETKLASQMPNKISIKPIPNYYYNSSKSYPPGDINIAVSQLAYLRHTSGTTSGLPKPIQQTNWGAVGALPRLTGDFKIATFSTTPLYHGGLADCFRAWTSDAMVWFFPEGLVPITAKSVVSAIEHARTISPYQIGYFTSVPYVLQLLAGHDMGVKILQTMEIVGVGGAALPLSVGDQLTSAGVNLVSRLGSAECGFLMSSHRDYSTDTNWQYLRPACDEDLLSFEPREGGLYELIAKPGWPLRAVTNREDGSYATSDLFQPHSSIGNAWRYHSRADSLIVLANGKKFDPSPIEGALLASTKALEDVLIFGTGKDFPGALLFPATATDESTEEEVLSAVWPIIERSNPNSQSHARLTRYALVVVPKSGNEPALEKSSKGTIMRRQAEERYSRFIESVYVSSPDQSLKADELDDDELVAGIFGKFTQVVGRSISLEGDVFHQGVDSTACIQIRKLIESSLLPDGCAPLPANIIYECGSIRAIADYIRANRQGGDKPKGAQRMPPGADEMDEMWDLAEAFSNFSRLIRLQDLLLAESSDFLGRPRADFKGAII